MFLLRQCCVWIYICVLHAHIDPFQMMTPLDDATYMLIAWLIGFVINAIDKNKLRNIDWRQELLRAFQAIVTKYNLTSYYVIQWMISIQIVSDMHINGPCYNRISILQHKTGSFLKLTPILTKNAFKSSNLSC